MSNTSTHNSLVKEAFPYFTVELAHAIEMVGEETVFLPGQIIVKQGKPFWKTYILLTGCVQVNRENEEGSEFIISYLTSGDSFAGSVSDDSSEFNKRSNASFTAIEVTSILTISFADKDLLAHNYDQWYKYILATAVKYYSFYIELIDNIAFKKMDHRIEYFLSRLSKTKKSMLLQISHQEIADGLNSSREVVSRLLKKMEEMGKIKLMHNSIKLIYL